jgi:hypothetical protein
MEFVWGFMTGTGWFLFCLVVAEFVARRRA